MRSAFPERSAPGCQADLSTGGADGCCLTLFKVAFILSVQIGSDPADKRSAACVARLITFARSIGNSMTSFKANTAAKVVIVPP